MPKDKEEQSLPPIGANVKAERLRQKLSLDELSASSGVSKAMLSRLEAGKVNPTVAVMWKIAQALRVDFNSIIKGDGKTIRRFEVNRSEDITRLDTDAPGVHINVLSPIALAEELELYILTLQPKAVFKSNAHLSGTEEILTVLDGEVKISADTRSSVLKTGDVVIYDADVKHSIENLTGKEARIHMAVRFKSNEPLRD